MDRPLRVRTLSPARKLGGLRPPWACVGFSLTAIVVLGSPRMVTFPETAASLACRQASSIIRGSAGRTVLPVAWARQWSAVRVGATRECVSHPDGGWSGGIRVSGRVTRGRAGVPGADLPSCTQRPGARTRSRPRIGERTRVTRPWRRACRPPRSRAHRRRGRSTRRRSSWSTRQGPQCRCHGRAAPHRDRPDGKRRSCASPAERRGEAVRIPAPNSLPGGCFPTPRRSVPTKTTSDPAA